jgi:uncharacterized protein YdeI (YjbR/CyaY-like superfamily)
MKPNFPKKIYIPTTSEWRSWLEKNHAKEKVIWLIYYKKHTGKARVPYNEAVEEALCFGWIDSTIKRIDEERYMQQFTPRNLKSNWSKLNKERVEKLLKQGKMTKAGMRYVDYAKKHGIWDKVEEPQPVFEFSDDLLKLLKANKKAIHFFESLSPSQQKLYKQWVMSAKKPETRLRRCKEMIGLLEKEQKLGVK